MLLKGQNQNGAPVEKKLAAITEVELFIKSQKEGFFKDILPQLIHRLEKCVALSGGYENMHYH